MQGLSGSTNEPYIMSGDRAYAEPAAALRARSRKLILLLDDLSNGVRSTSRAVRAERLNRL